MRMNNTLLAGTTALLIAAAMTPASAADMRPAYKAYAPAPVFTWTGFYAGLNAGYAFGDTRTDLVVPGGVVPFSSDYDGFAGGAQIGYNWQSGALVLGLEADLQYADVSGSNGMPPSFLFETNTLKWLGTARGRIGYAFDRFMPYLTGGFAFGKNEFELVDVQTTTRITEARTHTGWAFGGGVEFAVRDAWSVKIEYLHVNLGDKGGYFQNVVVPGGSLTADLEFDLVRGGLNYRF